MRLLRNCLATLLVLLATVPAARAQCTSPNTAFNSGETLIYDLYFNWKFVWVKAGTASMNITSTTYRGTPAYRTYLITRGSKRADKFFVMRDTLLSYTTHDLAPLYFSKRAKEGSRYTCDEAWYAYPDGKCKVTLRHHVLGKPVANATHTSAECAFDMLAMLLRARSFDASGFKTGHRIHFLMADGKRCEQKDIVYRGKKKFKMENSSTTYRCLVFSFVEREDRKEKEIVTFYITDDKNHLPVRLDMNLKFGTAKAFLTGARGLRNPQTSKLK